MSEIDKPCKRCNSYKTLTSSLEKQIKHHRVNAEKYDEAIKTLESERAANARLTEELEAMLTLLQQSAIDAAVLAEREACAIICDLAGKEWDSDDVQTDLNYAKYCGENIRNRG